MAGFFGVVFSLFPVQNGALTGMEVTEPFIHRLMGVTFFSTIALTSWWASRAKSWEEIKITLQMEIVFPFLGAIVVLWGLLSGTFSPFWWLIFLILVGFWAVFTFLYVKHRNQA